MVRLIFGPETCSICKEPGRYLLGSKPPETENYFSYQWFCEKHFHAVVNELKIANQFNKDRGEKAEFIVKEDQ